MDSPYQNFFNNDFYDENFKPSSVTTACTSCPSEFSVCKSDISTT